MYKLYNYKGEGIAACAVSPDCYGAVGDGLNDDTVYFQKALDENNYIICESSSIYNISSTLRIKRNTVVNLNGATINCSVKHCFYNFLEGDSFGVYNGNGNIVIKNGYITGGNISFIHAENVTIENVRFRNCTNDHIIEICACKDFTIRNCSFIGMEYLTTSVMEYINLDATAVYSAFPWNSSAQGTDFYDGTVSKNISIIGCYFSIGEDPYNNGYNAFGLHANSVPSGIHQDNIIIKDNIIKGFTGCGLRINDMYNVIISNNHIDTSGSCIVIGDKITSNNILISYNFLNSENVLIDKVSFSDLTVAYNSVKTDNQNI